MKQVSTNVKSNKTEFSSEAAKKWANVQLEMCLANRWATPHADVLKGSSELMANMCEEIPNNCVRVVYIAASKVWTKPTISQLLGVWQNDIKHKYYMHMRKKNEGNKVLERSTMDKSEHDEAMKNVWQTMIDNGNTVSSEIIEKYKLGVKI